MRTIIIGDGLTKSFLSTEQPFGSSSENVGASEIDRLLGRGREYGKGPLPSFLRLVVEQGMVEDAPRLVLLRGEGSFVDCIEPIAESARVIESTGDVIPWEELWSEISGDATRSIVAAPGEEGDLRFLVVGSHSERRILAIATYLRSFLGCTEVAVTPHLIGSSTPDAHFAALRHNFPSSGVQVLLDLREVAEFCGVDPSLLGELVCGPPEIIPTETRDALDDSQRRILELLCLNWTTAEIRPLAGGFSGSLLLLASGWKGRSRTEPMVLKVDSLAQMRRELDGYHQVKDFFGKHVPTFGYPVVAEDSLGVGMELAAMEGSPSTLQDTFEEAEDDRSLERFLGQLGKGLTLLSKKLYRNTRETTWVVPYRSLGLHTEQQVEWLRENAEFVLGYLENDLSSADRVDPESVARLMRLIARNPDGIDSEICLVHGDLNFANIICDEIDNVWFIDWTHSGHAPIELDFAKLENDAKFVMSKSFDPSDLPRLRELENYLLDQKIPGEVDGLPARLRFVKWDLRFRKIYETVRVVRRTCFELKESDDWLVYRVALLRYATHTLSFDKRRERGECEPPMLMHALFSVETLLHSLVMDDFNLKTRAERPPSYPPRLRVSIDEAPWALDCDPYDPPYHVEATVLENARVAGAGGWADPEDDPADSARARNPRGRTGLAGRGALGRWGANPSVAAVVVRTNPSTDRPEVLLGGRDGELLLEIPKGFILPDETAERALVRILQREVGWDPGATERHHVYEGYSYDPRQTDQAWVEADAFLLLPGETPGVAASSDDFEQIKWWELTGDTVNRMPTGQARLVRESVPRLLEARVLDPEAADRLLSATG